MVSFEKKMFPVVFFGTVRCGGMLILGKQWQSSFPLMFKCLNLPISKIEKSITSIITQNTRTNCKFSLKLIRQ